MSLFCCYKGSGKAYVEPSPSAFFRCAASEDCRPMPAAPFSESVDNNFFPADLANPFRTRCLYMADFNSFLFTFLIGTVAIHNLRFPFLFAAESMNSNPFTARFAVFYEVRDIPLQTIRYAASILVDSHPLSMDSENA